VPQLAQNLPALSACPQDGQVQVAGAGLAVPQLAQKLPVLSV